jgi:hypothetical protein
VSSSELFASTASARSLDDVHTIDAEVVRQRREKKASKVAQREERKKSNASLKRKHEEKSKESKFVKLVRREGQRERRRKRRPMRHYLVSYQVAPMMVMMMSRTTAIKMTRIRRRARMRAVATIRRNMSPYPLIILI